MPDRPVIRFVDRPGGEMFTPVQVIRGAQMQLPPGITLMDKKEGNRHEVSGLSVYERADKSGWLEFTSGQTIVCEIRFESYEMANTFLVALGCLAEKGDTAPIIEEAKADV